MNGNIKGWSQFNESEIYKNIDLLSSNDITEIILEDNLDEAMRITQDIIGITSGDVCGVYWTSYVDVDDADEYWASITPDRRLEHLKKYLELEDDYSSI